MPLIIISGYPSSGKTTRALQIRDYFLTKISAAATAINDSSTTTTTTPESARIARLKVHVVNDESLGISRDVYREARSEKEARATEYSAVKRLLGKDDVVIADGLNYIKGFRYQLFCEAKALLTPSCVVHVGTPADTCRLWNVSRNNSSSVALADSDLLLSTPPGTSVAVPPAAATSEWYAEDIFENLIFRYEEPNGMTRWDSPLFTVPYMDEKPDLDGIWEAMVGKGVKVKANMATVLKPATESNYLYDLDKTTQEVVTLILEHQKNYGGASGGELPVPECSAVLELPGNDVRLPQLQRIRRQFIALNRQHSLEKRRIRELFVEYVNGECR